MFWRSDKRDERPGRRPRPLLGKPGWPSDVPRLYPDLDTVELARLIDEDQFDDVLNFPLVYVLPLAPDETSAPLGVGLARLLIRALMLVPDLSVHGPEDTPLVPVDAIETLQPRTAYVGGEAQRSAKLVSATFAIRHPEHDPKTLTIPALPLADFVVQAAGELAVELGGHPTSAVRDAWRAGLPRSLDSLETLGELVLELDPHVHSRALERRALLLADAEPSFALPYHLLDGAKNREHLLRAFERDPHDAQLCFEIFCALWKSNGKAQPEAVQFIRRALELSPGHGKAHMCAPHAAPRNAGLDLLLHSELGYLLLPGNSFAANNYILALQRAGRPASEIVALVRKSIALDPKDPSGYERAVETFQSAGDLAAALDVARELVRLYEVMSPRTEYCIRQNPRRAARYASGESSPLDEARALVRKLEKAARPK